ncbi:unnamed protein product [Owenia fusiformis]|uniref:Fibrinogen C-terminal domain-containing protein n=1 Tax=Owenia fusiformis TaxID=6347 RepID=A0A8S4Q5K8_OWEFU|nr:unnamed protein product [Owenia fusiformis]
MMMEFIFSILLIGTLQVTSCCSNINGHTFQILKNKRCEAYTVIDTLYNIRSQTICLAKCAVLAECAGVNFEKRSTTCELIASSKIITCLFTTDADWNHGYENEHSQDCQALWEKNFTQDGVYIIRPNPNQSAFNAYCDMQGGGWTVIQRRYDGSVEFHNQNWTEYKNGFGDVSTEHWLGNDLIHLITNSGNYEIKFDLMTPDNVWHNATYSNFSIQDEIADYELSIGPFIGGNTDAIGASNPKQEPHGMKFSTLDVVNDLRNGSTCVEMYNGAGWWYNSCTTVNLNGNYSTDGVYHDHKQGIKWKPLAPSDTSVSLMATTMKVKRSP